MTGPTTTTQGEALEARALILAMEDFINEPPRRFDIEPMDVRDYRHEAYRIWSPVRDAFLSKLAALQPNIDHAVGGVTVTPEIDKALRSSLMRSHTLVEVLPSATPPVNQDAVREALGLARPIVEADLATANEYADGDWIGMSQTALDAIDTALATPPLDNTGLDAATVERCARVAERFDIDRSDCSLDDRDIELLNAGEQQACEGIAADIRALASGDRS